MNRKARPAKEIAIVLLSGGMDSAACLYWAKSRGWRLEALSIRYGQRHEKEYLAARVLAKGVGARLHEVRLKLPWLGVSSLMGRNRPLPDVPLARIGTGGVPSTYVPGRNTIFLALAVSLADAVGGSRVVMGANALDYSGYPDCRRGFIAAFQRVAVEGTKRGAEGRPLRIEAPLLRKDKAGIVRMAVKLKVPLESTWSCYSGGRRPCGCCDSCKLRAKGFSQARIKDPAP